MLGIGGGVVFVPSLYFLLPVIGIEQNVVPHFAISLSLCAGAVAASFSGVLHLRRENVDKKKAFLFASGSGIAAFISVIFVTSIDSEILKLVFAIVLLIVAVNMLIDIRLKREPVRKEKINDTNLTVAGFFAGILSAFTGLGGGIIYFPFLHYLSLLDTKKAIGTSSVITAITMISASISFLIHESEWIGHYNVGTIYLMFALPIGIGAVIGAKLGVNFVTWMRAALLKKIFAILLIIVVIKIIFDL